MVANFVEADLLILLSDIDGLYDDNPNTNINASLIDEVSIINEHIKSLAGDAGSSVGTGGMVTKLSAAEIMMDADKMMVIANSKQEWVIKDIVEGQTIGTLFRKDQ